MVPNVVGRSAACKQLSEEAKETLEAFGAVSSALQLFSWNEGFNFEKFVTLTYLKVTS